MDGLTCLILALCFSAFAARWNWHRSIKIVETYHMFWLFVQTPVLLLLSHLRLWLSLTLLKVHIYSPFKFWKLFSPTIKKKCIYCELLLYYIVTLMQLPCTDTELFYWLPLVASKAAKPKEAWYSTSVSLFFAAIDFSGKPSPQQSLAQNCPLLVLHL